MDEDKRLSNTFSWRSYFYFVRRVIEEAPLQIFITSLLIVMILGLFHGFVSRILGEADVGAFGWLAIPVLMLISVGLFIFYTFVYPLLRGYMLSIGLEYATHQKIPTLKSYTKQFNARAGKLVQFSLKRFGYQTISLGLIFFFSLAMIYIFNWFVFVFVYLTVCYISSIPAINGYKRLLFSELMIFNDLPYDTIIKTGKEISIKHNKTILSFKGTILCINFIMLLALAVFTQKPSFFQYFSLPSIIWPTISIVFDWDILYIFAFVLINTTFFIIETLFIPYAYHIYILERDVSI